MKTVSRTKTLLVTSLMPLFAAPMLAHAATPADASLDACVKAFVSTKFEKERRYSVVTTDASDFDPQARSYRISLEAKGKQTGKKLAKATCVVDHSGVVLSMNGKSYALPSTGESTVLSSR
ncbi:MAG: hypothetical protein ACJ8MH_19620 [Povalibacter sp.]